MKKGKWSSIRGLSGIIAIASLVVGFWGTAGYAAVTEDDSKAVIKMLEGGDCSGIADMAAKRNVDFLTFLSEIAQAMPDKTAAISGCVASAMPERAAEIAGAVAAAVPAQAAAIAGAVAAAVPAQATAIAGAVATAVPASAAEIAGAVAAAVPAQAAAIALAVVALVPGSENAITSAVNESTIRIEHTQGDIHEDDPPYGQ